MAALEVGAAPADGLAVGSLPHNFTEPAGAAPASVAAIARPEADGAGTKSRGSFSALSAGVGTPVALARSDGVGIGAALSVAEGTALGALETVPRLSNPDPPSTAPPASATATARSSTHP